MATIVGGIATSHTPTIGFALDAKKQQDPVWAPIFEGYEPVQQLARGEEAGRAVLHLQRPHHLVLLRPLLALRAGRGRRSTGWPTKAAARASCRRSRAIPALARHVANGLAADEFDLSYFQDKGLDHGCFSPLSLLWPHENDWPGAIVPLQVGVLQLPIPSARRCFKLGRSLRKAIESYPRRHQGGHRRHRRTFAPDPRRARGLQQHALGHGVPRAAGEGSGEAHRHHHRRVRRDKAACEGSEVIMWLIMRGALAAEGEEAAPGLLPAVDDADRHRDLRERLDRNARGNPQPTIAPRINHEWDGLEKLPGTYPFTLERSVKAYRLNYFLHSLHRSRNVASSSSQIPSRCSKRPASAKKNARWCARATGARSSTTA